MISKEQKDATLSKLAETIKTNHEGQINFIGSIQRELGRVFDEVYEAMIALYLAQENPHD